MRRTKLPVVVDLHVHTNYSSDSLITPKELIFYAKKNGLNAVAITDHNIIEGALKIAKETDFLVIPGMEVSSADGHIVALNLETLIPRGLTAQETVDRLHDAGGLAVACHPYAMFKGSLNKRVTSKFDAIETINASAFPFNYSRRKATEVAEKLGLPTVGGTDAHYGPAIGCGYTVIDAEPNLEAIAKAIINKKCTAYGKPVPFKLNFERTIKRLQNKLR